MTKFKGFDKSQQLNNTQVRGRKIIKRYFKYLKSNNILPVGTTKEYDSNANLLTQFIIIKIEEGLSDDEITQELIKMVKKSNRY